MPTITAIKTGNWSDPTVWSSGALPEPGDIVEANGYTVTINQSINVGSIRTTAGGRFTADAGGAIIGDIIAVTAICLSSSVTGGALSIIGNVTGGVDAASSGVYFTGAGEVLITGDVIGLGGRGVYFTGAGSLSITGDVIGGAGASAHGVGQTGAGSLSITGDVIGGAGASAHGVSQGGGAASISGSATGGGVGHAVNASSTAVVDIHTARGNDYPAAASPAFGALQTGTAVVRVKRLIFGDNGQTPTSGLIQLIPDINNWCSCLASTGGREILISSSAICDFPPRPDVRDGIWFDNATKEGECVVPAPESVAYGVPVDDTTGVAVLRPEDVPSINPTDIWTASVRTLTTPTGEYLLQYTGDVTATLSAADLPLIQDIRVVVGNDYVFDYQLLDANEDPIDITSWGITSNIREYRDIFAPLVAVFAVDKYAPTEGRFRLTLTDTQTQYVRRLVGWYDVLMSVGGVDKTWIAGKVDFIQIVTGAV